MTRAQVHSFSQEVDHFNELILVVGNRDVWRVEADPHAENGTYGIKRTRIFRLRVIEAVTAIQVYDSFAVISFADNSIVLVVRP